MRTGSLTRFLDARPPRPFVLRRADGHGVPPTAPESLVIAPGGPTAIAEAGGEVAGTIRMARVTRIRAEAEPIASGRG